MKEIIHKFLMTSEISRPASNKTSKKTVKGKSTFTPVQYLNVTKKEAFKTFRKKNPTLKCGSSYFMKIMTMLKIFRKAKRQTDMCKLCVVGKKLQKKIDRLEKELRILENSTRKRSSRKTIDDVKVALRKAKRLQKNFHTHKSDEEHQLRALRSKVDSLQPGSAVFIMDFKQNIKINQDPDVVLNKDFWKSCQ